MNACARFCEDVAAKRYRWLSLLGKSGRGKTHLARRIDAWRQTRGKGLYFYRWLDLVAQFRGDRDTIPRFMGRCDINRLLILDDIGAGYETEFAAAVLAEIAERRVGKPTVFTSNLSLEQIAGIDSRIASRMFRGESEVFTFKVASDYCLPRRKPVKIEPWACPWCKESVNQGHPHECCEHPDRPGGRVTVWETDVIRARLSGL